MNNPAETTSAAEEMSIEVIKALRKLKGATPSKRNGPCWQAINILRGAIGLDPMEVGGSATDGLEEMSPKSEKDNQDVG